MWGTCPCCAPKYRGDFAILFWSLRSSLAYSNLLNGFVM